MPKKPPPPFDILRRRIYTDKRCFYCAKLMRSQSSREDIFPLWLQKKFELSNQTLTLLNQTRIQYRHLKVPCCTSCNNVHLSQLENRVKTLLFNRSLHYAQQHLDQIYVWAMKILVGIIYAERLLPRRRRHPKGKPILPDEWWNSF